MGIGNSLKQTLIVGITGILGSGKTTVSKILEKMGFKVILCDDIVDNLLNKKKIINQMRKILGNEIVENGRINRKKVREIIFNDMEKKKMVEDLLHPLVFKEINENILDTRKKGGIIFIEIPLLFETKSENLFDKIIVVSASKKEIKKRLKNKYTVEEIENIWKNQLPLQFKKKKADFVIDNSGTILETEKKVKKVIEKLLKNREN